jgi:hypothetical protein
MAMKAFTSTQFSSGMRAVPVGTANAAVTHATTGLLAQGNYAKHPTAAKWVSSRMTGEPVFWLPFKSNGINNLYMCGASTISPAITDVTLNDFIDTVLLPGLVLSHHFAPQNEIKDHLLNDNTWGFIDRSTPGAWSFTDAGIQQAFDNCRIQRGHVMYEWAMDITTADVSYPTDTWTLDALAAGDSGYIPMAVGGKDSSRWDGLQNWPEGLVAASEPLKHWNPDNQSGGGSVRAVPFILDGYDLIPAPLHYWDMQSASESPLYTTQWMGVNSLDVEGRFFFVGDTNNHQNISSYVPTGVTSSGLSSKAIGYTSIKGIMSDVNSLGYDWCRSRWDGSNCIDVLVKLDPATPLPPGWDVEAVFFDQDIMSIFVHKPGGTASERGSRLVNLRYGEANIIGTGTYSLVVSVDADGQTFEITVTWRKTSSQNTSPPFQGYNRGGISEVGFLASGLSFETALGASTTPGIEAKLVDGWIQRDNLLTMSAQTKTTLIWL